VQRVHGGLSKIDPWTDKITVYLPPRSTTGTAGTTQNVMSNPADMVYDSANQRLWEAC